MMKSSFRKTLLIGVVALAAIGAAAMIKYFTSRAATDRIVLSGNIEADEIHIGSKVGGRVEKVLVREGDHVKAGPDLEPFVQEALEEIEYVVGSTSTTWGARRARDGHSAPFRLNYVEVGNEDGFDKARTYDGRFAQFADAIKARFPRLKMISTVPNQDLHTRKGDMVDLHFYNSTDEFLRMSRDFGANLNRNGPEIFVGEWAAHEDSAVRPWDAPAKKLAPTPPMKSAIGDAVFMSGERAINDHPRPENGQPS